MHACTDTLFLGGEPRQALHISSIITQCWLVHSLTTPCLLSFVICYILCSVGMNGYWTPKNVSRSQMPQESRTEAVPRDILLWNRYCRCRWHSGNLNTVIIMCFCGCSEYPIVLEILLIKKHGLHSWQHLCIVINQTWDSRTVPLTVAFIADVKRMESNKSQHMKAEGVISPHSTFTIKSILQNNW